MRLGLAIFAVFASALLGNTGERKTTMYPGTCPDGQSWYLIESNEDSITVGCNDPDYDEPESDHDLGTETDNNAQDPGLR